MSTSRASSPMSRSATTAADNDFYSKHPEMVQDGKRMPIDPNNPAQAGMRQEWMGAYAKHGGKVEPIAGADVRNAKKQANKDFPKTPPGAAVLPCAYKNAPRSSDQDKGASTAPSGAQPQSQSVTPVPVKRAPPSAPAGQDSVCELVSAKISCSHGRHPGKEGVLMVVASSSGDTIDSVLSMKGGCGQHPSWSVGGKLAKEGKGNKFSFNANGVSVLKQNAFSLKNVSPNIYQVQLVACGGGPLIYEIRAYPAGKIKYKIDFRELKEKLESIVQILPINEDEERRDREENKKGKFEYLHGIVEFAGEWKEVDVKVRDRNWETRYEMSWSGGFDPLVAYAWRFQIYPPSIMPGWLSEYIHAGLFGEIKGNAAAKLKYAGSYWPSDGQTEWGETSFVASGEITVGLSLELKLASKALVEGVLAGESGIAIEGEALRMEGDPALKIESKFSGLTAKATLKAAWGFVEYSREFVLVEPREIFEPYILKSVNMRPE